MGRKLIIALVLLFCLTGCISTASNVINAKIPTGNVDENGKQETVIKPVALDRWGANVLVRMEEEKTQRALIAAEQAKEQPAAPQRKEDIQVILDTPEAIQAWTSIENSRSMATVNTNLSNALKACVSGKKSPTLDLRRTKAPKGVFAESVTAITSGTADILNTDAAKIGTFLFGSSALVDSAQPDQPTTSIQATGDVAAGSGAITKPVTTSTEILQPSALEQ